MSSLPFPPLSSSLLLLLLSLSSYSSFFILQRSSHSHVRVAGLFLSPSQPRPTGCPLRPWSSTRPSFFLLLQSHLLLLRSLFLHLRFSTTTTSIVTPGLFLLRPLSRFRSFWKTSREGSRGTFWDQCRCDCPTSRYIRFLVVAAVRHFSFSVPEFPARPKSRRKPAVSYVSSESAVESTLTTTAAMITRLKPVSYLRDIYFNILTSRQDPFSGTNTIQGLFF